MKLTETKLKQMILLEMARIPPHIPTTDPEISLRVLKEDHTKNITMIKLKEK